MLLEVMPFERGDVSGLSVNHNHSGQGDFLSTCMMQVPQALASCKRGAYEILMLGRLYDGQECSAAGALEEIGERWSLLILRDAAFRGFTRFSGFQRALGVAPNIL